VARSSAAVCRGGQSCTACCGRAQATVRRRILEPEVIDFISKADQTYQLTRRERIALGLLAQGNALTARELAAALELPSVGALQPWLKRLLDWDLV
jgi:ATP-dependent DNA helicase RecG